MNRWLIAAFVVVAALIGVYVVFFHWGDEAPVVAKNGKGDSTEVQAPKRMSSAAPEQAPRPPVLTSDPDPVGTLLLEGQVIDANEQAVPAAIVTLGSNPARTTKTEDDGSFSFDKLIGRSYQLTARADDLAGGPVDHALKDGSNPVIIRMREGGQVHVVVVDQKRGDAIEGVNVELRSTDFQNATTDATGKASFRGVPAGFFTVVASKSGYGTTRQFAQVPDNAGVKVDVRVAMRVGAPVSGIVVDVSGKPIADARVLAHDVSDVMALGVARIDGALTDSRGRFEIPALSAGSYRLVASHDKYPEGSSEQITVDGSTPKSDVSIELATGATMKGSVVTTDGVPVAWASVRVRAPRPMSGFEGFGTSARVAMADDQGEFEIDGLPQQMVEVLAISHEASSDVIPVNLSGKTVETNITLRLTVMGTISGVVVDGAGEPVADLQLMAFPDFWAGADIERFAMRGQSTETTNGAGTFQFRGLPDGTYRLRPQRLSYTAAFYDQRGSVSAKTGDTDVRIVIEDDGGIKGVVQIEGGEVPELFTVTIGYPPGVPVSDKRGVFELPAVPPGSYDVTIRGPTFAPKTIRDVEVAPGATTDMGTIVIPRGRQVVGRVVDATGSPIADAEVVVAKQLIGSGKNLTADFGAGTAEALGQRTAHTGSDGGFRIIGIEEMALVIAAEHTERGRSMPVQLVAGKDDVTVELVLQGFASVYGKVTAGGKPADSLQVVATPKQAVAQNIVVTTGADGSYQFDRLAAGEYRVLAMLAGSAGASSGSKDVELKAGDRILVDIAIEMGDIELTVTVKRENGGQVDAAQVFLFKGLVSAKSGKDIQEAFLTSSKDGSGKMAFSFGGKPAVLAGVTSGSGTLCIIPITGDMNDPKFAQRLQENSMNLEVHCRRHTVKESPKKQSHTVEVPPMAPLPEPSP